jgi:hypothetical protein
MIAVAGVAIALGASRLSHLDLLFSYELIVVAVIGLSPILICYTWLRDSRTPKSSIPIETLIVRFAGVIVVGVILWAVLVLLVAPFH